MPSEAINVSTPFTSNNMRNKRILGDFMRNSHIWGDFRRNGIILRYPKILGELWGLICLPLVWIQIITWALKKDKLFDKIVYRLYESKRKKESTKITGLLTMQK